VPHRIFVCSAIAVLVGAVCNPSPQAGTGASTTTFIEVSQSIGIDITPTGERGDWGHGAAFCDYDGDGILDLYVAMDNGQPNRLFKREAGGVFADIAPSVGCADGLDGRAVVWADYDNDGDTDFFLSNHSGPDRLYQNNGSGSFIDVAFEAGVDYNGRSHSAAWGDYDNDGYLDLYVCTYGTTPTPDPNKLYRNNRDGTFVDVGQALGVSQDDKPALSVVWVDYDNDNDVDLYVANDKYRGNALFHNKGDGTFEDRSAFSNTNLEFNAMGIAVGDYDRNGYLDLYVTNTEEGNELLHNIGNGTFSRVALATGVVSNRLGWGTGFFDYDNDGDDDLYVVNWAFTSGNPMAGNFLFRNDGATFTNVTAAAGVGDTGPGYALTLGDYNNDGYVDMFVNNQNERSVFYESVPGGNKWLKIKAVGTQSNRDGIGARIVVETGGIVQSKDVRSGSSYLSQLSPEVEFGLAGVSVVDLITITWPSGIVDVFDNVAANQYLVANEGGSLHPVAVFIQSFEATPVETGIELSWFVVRDENISGYRIYRREGDASHEITITERLLEPLTLRYVDYDVRAGIDYGYVLAVVDSDGRELRSQLVRTTATVQALDLAQNYPNPFNPRTLIRFSLPTEAHVTLVVYDGRGRRVVTLADGVRPAGPNAVEWDGRDAAGTTVVTGVYFYHLKTGGKIRAKKMLLLK
jgi:hypothetical protein